MMSTPANNRNSLMAVMFGAALGVMTPNLAAAEESAVRDLSRYCTVCWRNAGVPIDRWADCTQEVLCELLERVPLAEWSKVLRGSEENRREFLRVVDLVKKRTQREKKWVPLDAVPGSEPAGPDPTRLDETREEVRLAARELLTDRQQHILQRSAEGFGVADIAAELNLSTSRVSDEKYKAIQKLREFFVNA